MSQKIAAVPVNMLQDTVEFAGNNLNHVKDGAQHVGGVTARFGKRVFSAGTGAVLITYSSFNNAGELIVSTTRVSVTQLGTALREVRAIPHLVSISVEADERQEDTQFTPIYVED